MVLRLANFFMRLEARLSFALIGLVQATGYAGGLDLLSKTVSLNLSAACSVCASSRCPEKHGTRAIKSPKRKRTNAAANDFTFIRLPSPSSCGHGVFPVQ